MYMTSQKVMLSFLFLITIHSYILADSLDVKTNELLKELDESPVHKHAGIYLSLSELHAENDPATSKKYANQALQQSFSSDTSALLIHAQYLKAKALLELDSLFQAWQLIREIYPRELLKKNDYDLQEKEQLFKILLLQAKCLYKMGTNYRESLNKLKFITEQELLSNEEIRAEAYFLMGTLYHHLQMIDKAEKVLLKAEEIYKRTGNLRMLVFVLERKAVVFADKDPVKGLRQIYDGIELLEQNNDTMLMAPFLCQVASKGASYLDDETIISYYKRAIQLYASFDDESGVAYAMNGLGMAYSRMGRINDAIAINKKGAQLCRETGNHHRLGFFLNNLGYKYRTLGLPDSAYYFFSLANEVTGKDPDKRGQLYTLSGLGDLKKDKGEYQAALKYYLEALKLLDEVNDLNSNFYLHKQIASVYQLMNHFSKALEYYRTYTTLKDSALQKDREKAIAQMQIRYDTESKEKEIDILRKTKQLQQTRLKQNQVYIIMFATGFFIVLTLSVIIFIQRRKKQIAYNRLVEKNLQLINMKQGVKKKPASADENHELSEEVFESIRKKLSYLISKKKVFINKDLTLSGLAKKAGTNTAYLSRFINKKHNANFSTFINELRVKEAQKMMADPAYKNYAIEGIANSVGFKSKSVFNNAFKKFTGVTPSYYINYLQEKKI
ncbi:MAG: helix-turn-helix domain-containing protein [Bacteroidales bacterium]|nr:helix-turn-helix domain-containing protein [Bacteroidales bacterium]MCF8349708.1 helix-turn-helix domain-containing protein [Bacteroidales bacterium]